MDLNAGARFDVLGQRNEAIYDQSMPFWPVLIGPKAGARTSV